MIKAAGLLAVTWLLAACSQTPTTPREEAAARSESTQRAQIHTDLAAHYYARGQYLVALTEVKEAQAIEPKFAPAYNVLALIHAQLREDREAEENFRKSIDLAPHYAEVRNNYGYYLCQRGRYVESLPLFEAAWSNSLYATPEKPLANAGLCALHKGDPQLAESYLMRALARAPNQSAALLGMAELQALQGNPLAAKSYLKPLMDSGEFKAQVLWLALRLERAMGNREAEASYGSLLRRNHPESLEVKRLLEGGYDKMGALP
jgi:type IV pilus assembly protein PilF